MTRIGHFNVEPAPSGWHSWCIVPDCGWSSGGGHDQADALSLALEHAELCHVRIEPEPTT